MCQPATAVVGVSAMALSLTSHSSKSTTSLKQSRVAMHVDDDNNGGFCVSHKDIQMRAEGLQQRENCMEVDGGLIRSGDDVFLQGQSH